MVRAPHSLLAALIPVCLTIACDMSSGTKPAESSPAIVQAGVSAPGSIGKTAAAFVEQAKADGKPVMAAEAEAEVTGAEADKPGDADKPEAAQAEADEPKADTPDSSEAAADEPEADTPASNDPEADTPQADTPTDTPASDEPKADEPTSDEPEGDEPEADKPEAGEAKKPEPETSRSKPRARPRRPKKATPPPVKVSGSAVWMKKCKGCHGVSGDGKGRISSFKTPGWKAKWTTSKIKRIVTNGKAGTKMKSFKGKLTPQEIAAVSSYARSLGR